MAKLRVVAVFDSKIKGWMQPSFHLHLGQILRSWEELVNDGQSPMSRHPGDFTLFEIGEWDDVDGSIKAHSAPVSLSTAMAAKNTAPQPMSLPFPKAN